jgi:predicted RNA-binding Zn-ribbon protein involved in translation (DUF1610 family)
LTVQEFASLFHSSAVISEAKRLARELIARTAKASSPRPSAHYDWKEATHVCPNCGWSGAGRDATVGETYADGAEYHCPKCERYFGYICYPLISESLSDPRAPSWDRLFAEVVTSRVEAERIAEKAIAKAAR